MQNTVDRVTAGKTKFEWRPISEFKEEDHKPNETILLRGPYYDGVQETIAKRVKFCHAAELWVVKIIGED